MKRDLDLIRKLLLEIEESMPGVIGDSSFETNQGDKESVAYSLYLMEQHGLIDACKGNEMGIHEADQYYHISITWSGHDFLDAIRDDKIWREAKEGVKAVGGFTFELLKQLATGLVKTKIEKHTGIKLES